MALILDGNGLIQGLSAGGLPNGSIDADSLASTLDLSSKTMTFGNVTASGITFPASVSASGNPNTLDDYEEGTWTPTLPNGGTLTVNSATYTKIGRQVTVTFYVTSVAPTNNGSEFQIGGLPFSNVNITGYYMGGSFAYVGDANLTGWMPITGTGLDVIYFHAQGVTSQRTNAQYITASGSTDSIIVSITYWAA